MNTIFPQIDNQILSQYRGLRAPAYTYTPSPRNKGSEQNLITRKGGATLTDFVVALAQDMIYPFAHASRNQTQGRRLQLVEILYS